MEYEEVKFSRSRIEKVGKIIAKCDLGSEEYAEVIPVVDNWRAAHAFPLDQINLIVSKSLYGMDGVLIVQRLKRVESIIGKLQRENNTGLYRMQDLGGCRVIVRSMEELYEAVSLIKSGLIKNGHDILRETDYIELPREISGYRSYHIVVKYRGNEKYDGMSIEVQIRTKMQHAWATAVEIIDAIMEESLKIGTGSKKYMYFFKLISALFSISENTTIVSGVPMEKRKLIDEIYLIDNRENIREKLSAYNAAIKYEGSYPEQADYYLLITDLRNKTITSRSFNKTDIEKATKLYQSFEDTRKKNCTDVVLVAGKSFGEIRDSYPNYFMETLSFLGKIAELCKEYPEPTSIQFSASQRGIQLLKLFNVNYYDRAWPENSKLIIDGIGEIESNTVFCPEFSMTLDDSYLRFSSIFLEEINNKIYDLDLPRISGPAVIIMKTGASFFVDNTEWSFISEAPMLVVTCKLGVDKKWLKLLLGWLKSNVCMWDILYNNHSNSAYYEKTFKNMYLPNIEEEHQRNLLERIDEILSLEKKLVIEYNRIKNEETEESSSVYELIDGFNEKMKQKLAIIEEKYINFYGLSADDYRLIKQDINKKGYFVYQGLS